MECRMARRQAKCQQAFDDNGNVTQQFISSIGYVFRNKSFVEFSTQKLNEVISAGSKYGISLKDDYTSIRDLSLKYVIMYVYNYVK
jgi:hypothetical protein